ncbi:MAG: zinc ribbon domain-containing protein [bacterium]|nr:zinc ribbon domain-containing protein [bacterium]
MHCKHCGNQIEDDSKFCSFCGGRVEFVRQATSAIHARTHETVSNPASVVPNNSPTSGNGDAGLLVAFIMMVGIRLFWFISDIFTKEKEYAQIESYYEYVVKPSYILFWATPIVLALYSKRKTQKLTLLVLGLLVLAWSIYENFIKQV